MGGSEERNLGNLVRCSCTLPSNCVKYFTCVCTLDICAFIKKKYDTF